MLARDNNKNNVNADSHLKQTLLCASKRRKFARLRHGLLIMLTRMRGQKAFVSASTIASMLVPRTFFLVEATNLWHTARFFWNRVSCLFKFSNPDTCLHHPVQTSIVIGRTRGVIVTVLINKRYMFSLLGRCQKYAINDRCHHQVYVIHKYAISDRFITTIAHSTLSDHVSHHQHKSGQ